MRQGHWRYHTLDFPEGHERDLGQGRPPPIEVRQLSMDRLQMSDLKRFSRANDVDIIRLETALMRLGRDFIKKGKMLQLELK